MHSYLHHYANPQIIHRDLKANNILLDDKLNPVVVDFGLAKLIPEGSPLKGISGYSAPKIGSGKVSESCDVFSFGILLMELISGKRPIERISREKQAIMKWARPLVLQRKFHDLVDPKLEGKFDKDELTRLVQVNLCIPKKFLPLLFGVSVFLSTKSTTRPWQVAALCTDILPEERPSMQDVVEILKDGAKDIVKPPVQHGSDGLRLHEAILLSSHPVGTDVDTILVSKTRVI
jgi:interleukin-1 receptor-associated kinase 1